MAVLNDDLLSARRETGKIQLQLMRPNLVKLRNLLRPTWIA